MRIRIVSILLLALASAAGCRNGTTATPLAHDQELPADQVIYEIQHTMTANGIRNAVLTGDSAYLYQSGRTMDVIGVELTFYSEAGRQTGFLTAERGNYNSASGMMVARGNVVLVTRDTDGERRLETEELHYDLNGDRMWSDVEVVMREGGTTLHGTSFRADARFQNRTVTGARTSGGLESEGRRISF